MLITVHGGYNPTTLAHDLALLELAEEADLTVYTPVCVAGAEDPGVAEAEVVEVPDSRNFAVTSTTVRLLAQCDPVNSKLL